MIDFDRGEILHDEVIGNLHLRLREFVLTIVDLVDDEKTTIPLSDIDSVSVDEMMEETDVLDIINNGSVKIIDEEDDDEEDVADEEEPVWSNLSLIVETTGSSIEFLAVAYDDQELDEVMIDKLNRALNRFATSVQDQIDFLFN